MLQIKSEIGKMDLKAITQLHTVYKRLTLEPKAQIGWKLRDEGFPGGAVVENPPANAGDMGSSPGLGRSHMPWSN